MNAYKHHAPGLQDRLFIYNLANMYWFLGPKKKRSLGLFFQSQPNEIRRVFQVGWSLKFTSRLLFATGGSLLPDSHLYLPPHLCGACCATGRNRLPVVVVRNPFSRLASGWRPLA